MNRHRQNAPVAGMGRWNRFMVVVVGILLVSWGGPAASAFWGSVSSGFGAAKADALAQGAKPTTSVSGTNVTVGWSASTTAAGRSVTGYSIARYSSATTGTPVQATGTCAATVTALSCVESNVPAGTWYYSVTPMLSLWQGAESTRSAGTTPVTDTTAPDAPSVNAPAALNATTAGEVLVKGTAEPNSTITLTISGSGAQPKIQQLATDSTGKWAAAVVDLRGFGDGTITYSATAADAAGNVSLAGSATSSKDATAPKVTGVRLNNGGSREGKIDPGDTVTLTYSEVLKVSTINTAWTDAAGGSPTQNVTVSINSGNVLTVSAGSSPTLRVGSVDLGAIYGPSPGVLTYSGSTMAWDATARTLTITLGTTVQGTPSNANRSALAATYTPASGITDVAGNLLATTPVAGAASNF
ncbi:hypothetical protein [Arthrobacter sp. EpRS71]|uniref:hypothetical protein n=1 Tax=Arthrobacter sp. EpRS71 TaxID=1743141 RepID=UPI000AA6AE04|nr:hypothetical protein [Arthrobacter sp. EpRS71]